MTKRLTKFDAERTKPPVTGRLEIFDSNVRGLSLRITPNGSRTWYANYRSAGKLRRKCIGSVHQVELASARQIVLDIRKLLAEGKDPEQVASAHEAAKEAARGITFAEAAQRYIDEELPKKRWKEPARILKDLDLADWSDRRIGEITRADLFDKLGEVAKRPSRRKRKGPQREYRAQSNKVCDVLKMLFGWCEDAGIIKENPARGLKRRVPSVRRKRVLTDPELRAFWASCEKLGEPFGPFYKLLALTAKRESEIAKLEWREIDWSESKVELPAERVKNGEPHNFPLTPLTIKILKGVSKIGKKPSLVFTTNGKSSISGFSRAKNRIDALMLAELRKGAADPDSVTLDHWTNHDLRRTVKTRLSRIGVSDFISERVLGHSKGMLGETYDQHDYIPERREALEKWEAALMAIAQVNAQANVIPLIQEAAE